MKIQSSARWRISEIEVWTFVRVRVEYGWESKTSERLDELNR
jgi:hypothetical protein